MCLLAGCSVPTGAVTGDLYIRTRNMTSARQTLSIEMFVANEEDPSVKDSTTIPATTGGAPPWPEHIWHRENVRASESYRVVAVINGQQYEYQDTANCINEDREGETEFSARHELVDITIQSDEVKVLSGDCPVESETN
jgi:hypothetical protein